MSAGFRGSGPLGPRTLQRVLGNLRAEVGPAKRAMPLWRCSRPVSASTPAARPTLTHDCGALYTPDRILNGQVCGFREGSARRAPTSSLFTITSYLAARRPPAGPNFKWPGMWVWGRLCNEGNFTSSLFTIHSYFGGPQAAKKPRRHSLRGKGHIICSELWRRRPVSG